MKNKDDNAENYGKLSQAHYKLIRSLETKKQRKKQGLFVVEGDKIVSELLGTNIKIRTIFGLKEWWDVQLAEIPINAQKILITSSELKRISFLNTPNKVLAIAESGSLPQKKYTEKKPALLLDAIQDPGNMGTILRTACWFGIDQVICSMDTADHLNPKVVQASMGAFAHLNIIYKNLETFLKEKDHPAVIGALLKGANIHEANFTENALIMIGNESKGIKQALRKYITHPVSIPKYGPMESLNAAIATAIISFQFRKGAYHHP